MKYLKLFESKQNVVKVVVIDFTGGADGVTALYTDGLLEFYGDYYHDKIDDKIAGFILGLKWVKENFVYPLVVEEQKLFCTDSNLVEQISDFGNTPPKNLSDLDIQNYEVIK